MIQGLFVKWIFKAIYRAIERKHNLKKIDNYVNKPNELDRKMKQMNKTVNKYGKYIEELEKTVAILKKESHPPVFGKADVRKIERRLKKLERKNA